MDKRNEFMGREVEDAVTGQKGICTGYCYHITGCDTVGIYLKDKNETTWSDVLRVKLTKKGKKKRIELDTRPQELKTGAGPNPTSSRSNPA